MPAEPTPQLSLASDAEDAEARRALQGIDDIETAAAIPRRVYEGPRDADTLLAHLLTAPAAVSASP